jgi:hypothetical protein
MRFIGGTLRLILALSILAGIGSAIGAYVAKLRLFSKGEPADDEIDLVAIYDARDLTSTAPAFRRATVTAWYGGGTLDLRGATLDPAGATLSIRAIFGGYRLVVPASWRVELATVGILGGVGDGRDKELVDAGGPVLTIEGFAILGGVGIVSEAPDLEKAESEVDPDAWEAAPAPA